MKLGAGALTLEDLVRISTGEPGKPAVTLSGEARQRVAKTADFLKSKIAEGGTHYGINTGFGLLAQVRIPASDIEQLQLNLLRSHACGTGEPLADAQVRAMLLLRANTLIQGHSGVRVEVVEQILGCLNAGVHPVIPEQGSVGASGDLAPLAHLALVLIGEGEARFRGKVLPGAEALASAGMKPLKLGAKEGLALINGTQFMTAIGALALAEAEHLCDVADAAGALTLEALKGTEAAFDPRIHRLRPHPGQVRSAAQVRALLTDGGPSGINQSHDGCDKVQDPYSLRCIPQVHGASRDFVATVRTILEREINAVTDNPLVFPAEGDILSGGNFHGQVVAMAMDVLCMAVAELASISEERLAKLVNPAISGLPAFLTAGSGLNSGFMMVQVSAAAIVSENKTLCHPASVDSIPTSADKEDHVSMGAWAARKAARVVANTRRVLGMELLGAAQGIDLLRPLKSTPALEALHALIRARVPKLEADRAFAPDFVQMDALILGQELDPVLQKVWENQNV